MTTVLNTIQAQLALSFSADLSLVSASASREIHEEWEVAVFVQIIHQLFLHIH